MDVQCTGDFTNEERIQALVGIKCTGVLRIMTRGK